MPDRKTQTQTDNWRLPFGFFAGPVLWALEILVGYSMATVSCINGSKWPVYLTIGIAGLIVLVAGVLAYQAWRSKTDDSIWIETNQAQESPTFWMVSGFMISTLFFLLILATAVAALFLSPCPIITMPFP